jgi:hypothetical protein
LVIGHLVIWSFGHFSPEVQKKINFQFSIFNFQFSIFNFQFSIFNFQLSIFLQMKHLFALSALFLSIGCTPPPVKFDLGSPFSLKIGQTGECNSVKGFSVKFDKVTADSRCPQGVECITAGRADLALTLSKDGASQPATLSFTIAEGTNNRVDFKGHTVRVIAVEPLRKQGVEIKPGDYTIQVVVTETPKVPTFEPGKSFAIATGETIQSIENEAFSIRFDSVVGDSRCPQGVQCIWAGRADCAFTFTRGEQGLTDTLSSGDLGRGGAGEANFGGYFIQIKDIAPPKTQGAAIAQKDYKATLVVTKE